MTPSQGQIGLVVETVAPGETYSAVTRRLFQFVEAGVAEVWVLDAESRTLRRAGPAVRGGTLMEEDEAAGVDYRPLLRCRLSDLLGPLKEEADP